LSQRIERLDEAVVDQIGQIDMKLAAENPSQGSLHEGRVAIKQLVACPRDTAAQTLDQLVVRVLALGRPLRDQPQLVWA
jgi:hypothetical protein